MVILGVATNIIPESQLHALAKSLRLKSGKSKAAAGRELGVTRGNIHAAEEYPEQSLTSLRIRMIEKYSNLTVEGPLYRLKRK